MFIQNTYEQKSKLANLLGLVSSCSFPDKSVFDELAMQKQNASKVELTNNLFSIEQSSLENCSLFEYQIPANKNIDLVIRRSFVVF